MTWMELILRMLLCLLIAGVIGGIIGWLLRRLFAEKNNTSLEEAWQSRLAGKEREWDLLRTESRKQLAATEGKLNECNEGAQAHLATIADHETKYAALQASFDAKASAFEQLSAEAAALKEKLTSAETAATAWQGKFTTAEASLTGKQSELGELAVQLAAATALAATLKGGSEEAEKLKAENALLRQRFSSLEGELTHAREWEDKHQALFGEHEALQQQLHALQATSEARAHELTTLQGKLSASETALAAVQGKLATAETSVAQQQATVGDLTTKLAAAAALATQLQARTGEGEKLTAENNDLRTRLSVLESELASANEWQGKYTALVGERDQLQTQLANLHATSHAQASDWEKKALAAVSDKDREIQELQKRVQELGPQAKDWEVKYLAVLDEKQRESQTLRNRVAELEPLSGLLSAMQAAAKTKDTHIHTLEARVKDLEAAVVPDLEAIEGIGPVYFQKLSSRAGISWQKELLEQGKTAAGRKEIAEKTGILETLILRWVNHCDLRRVKGITEQYAELLEAAGVDSVPELAQRNADNLHAKVVATNEAKHVSPATPSAEDIQDWVAQAKTLPRVVTH